MGYLPQDIELFEGPIKSNIARFGDEDAESVVAAAKLAGVHDFIMSLPDGYDTLLGGEHGKLSVGQRQRIALARAVYGTPKLVVLDEPNSNLDDDGDKALLEAVTQLNAAGTSVVVVSHRPSLVSVADYMAVLDSGRIVTFDTASNVMSRFTPDSSPREASSNLSSQPPKPKVPTVTWPTRSR